jgi:hypothetical protein
MANYTIAVGWSGKDALADSDAGKVISGADFNTEFTAVQTAVNTKADLAGSASQAFSATTASTGTNTTQVATTAFVQNTVTAATINNLVYPVGSIYMNAAVSTNPATLLGFGTWAAYAEGKVPVGKASSGTFDTLNATGGAETDSHTLTLSEIPSHNHSNGSYDRLLLQNGQATIHETDGSAGEPNLASSGAIQAAGGGAAHTHDILQPYIVVYMWKRTA